MSTQREPIGVIGTGYVGLVTAAGFAELGNDVWCIDIDADKIARLERGEIPIYEPGLEELVTRHRGRLHFSTDIANALEHARLLFVAVGTPPTYSGDADLSAVHAVVNAMPASERHALVMKSTVPVGTGTSIKRVFGEQGKEGFRYVSCPEFLKEGTALADFLKPDRVVIGTDDPKVEAIMRELYEPFVRTGHPILVMDHASAELAKYAANAMLATRISFMNEIANLCDRVGADVRQVRLGIGTDTRIGSSFLFPGIGYGGSCFPKDVKALLRTAQDAGCKLSVVQAVDDANNYQKSILVPRVEAYLGSVSGKVIALWGLAFKPRTDDMRDAPALSIIEALTKKGASVRVYDPKAMAAAKRVLGDRVTYCAKSYEAAEGADALVIVTEWGEFREPDFERLKGLMRRPAIFDGRNVYKPEHLREIGFHYEGIGRR